MFFPFFFSFSIIIISNFAPKIKLKQKKFFSSKRLDKWWHTIVCSVTRSPTIIIYKIAYKCSVRRPPPPIYTAPLQRSQVCRSSSFRGLRQRRKSAQQLLHRRSIVISQLLGRTYVRWRSSWGRWLRWQKKRGRLDQGWLKS